MPELVTAAQLRSVLGVSTSLYNDAALNEYIEAAEDAIGDFLVQWSVALVAHESKDDVITEYTDREHKFYVGQTVVLTRAPWAWLERAKSHYRNTYSIFF
jgi:hypothetical protein